MIFEFGALQNGQWMYFQPHKNHFPMKKSAVLLFAFVAAAVAVFSLFKCKNDGKPATDTDKTTINVRLETDVEGLNPFLTNNANAIQVYQKIFLTLADFEPTSMEIKPILIKEMPVAVPIDTGAFKGGIRYDFEILPEAKWDNGQPITAADFIFTMKTILVPNVAAGIWRGYEDFLGDIQPDPANPKRFSVFAKKYYMLAVETLTGTPILPESIYDPTGILKKYAIRDLLDPKKAADFSQKNPELAAFAAAFKSPLHTREVAGVSGSGQYKLDEIVTGQRIVLSKKVDWWGEKLAAERPILGVFPQKIVYKPVTDHLAAITLLKDGGLDVVKNVPPAMFDELKKDPAAAKLQFANPELMEFSQIILNTRKPALKDRRTRRALAQLLDLDAGLSTIMRGYAVRSVGPFHPSKPYFNKNLVPIKFDPEAAKTLLAEAGWADSDKNGVLDQKIGGKMTELNLTFRVSPKSELGKAVALQLQENARKIGVKIELIQKDMTAITEDMKKRDFDLVAMRALQFPLLDEPYQTWHTKSDTPDGGNRSGFGSAASDKVMEEIRSTRDVARRDELYIQLQQMIYDEQPVIFLFVPTERIAMTGKWKPVISVARPGFFEQYFR